jgi:phosphohistidine phosphatase
VKTLLVLRHGKSSWAEPDLDDHDRPLKKRGRRGARSIGRQLQQAGLLPDLVLSSTARRARATARRCLAASGAEARLEITRALYGSGARRHLEELGRRARDDDRVVMVVGHNPDLEDLVALLTGEPTPLKTAFLAVITLDVERWPDLATARGRLDRLLRPQP